jgi:glycosyltransferase involved in cell wall biosynthesis
MPNDKDAMAIPVLEALACDLPVVAVDSGSPADIITPQNCCGLLVEGEDSGAFASAVIKFATDENFYYKCSSNASRIVKDKFNIDKNVEETYNLYIRSVSAGH